MNENISRLESNLDKESGFYNFFKHGVGKTATTPKTHVMCNIRSSFFYLIERHGTEKYSFTKNVVDNINKWFGGKYSDEKNQLSSKLGLFLLIDKASLVHLICSNEELISWRHHLHMIFYAVVQQSSLMLRSETLVLKTFSNSSLSATDEKFLIAVYSYHKFTTDELFPTTCCQLNVSDRHSDWVTVCCWGEKCEVRRV